MELFAGTMQVEMRALLRKLLAWQYVEETIALEHSHAKSVMATN
jgi:hypothetical protein